MHNTARLLIVVLPLSAYAADGAAGPGENKLRFTLEQRGRYEQRTGTLFGKEPDVATGLVRTRLGLNFAPAPWLKVSGMVQDSRAPWYGRDCPGTIRDPADLHEAFIELFPSATRGFGLTAGRMMLNYGEGRLIGTPQWGNISRTYDHARVYWRFPKARFEFLLTSPVKIQISEFNRPVLSDRVWGSYNVFPDLYGNLLEAYILRHDQVRPDRMGVNTFGFRLAGPLSAGMKYSLETALQRGKIGPADLHGAAFFAGVSRRWNLAGMPIDVSADYKHASRDFEQLYGAHHDRFGHQDLFGSRNIHSTRGQATLTLTRYLGVTFLYDDFWLASARGGVYNGSGKLVAGPKAGNTARHIGREADLFAACKYRHFTFGAGYGYFRAGDFIRKSTPGIGPTYIYVFHSYSL